MQTFLPFPEFARSAAALDNVRLGKQRVEVLQILRATTFPSYGWGNHPATLMWRGFVPALANYGVAMADEWMSRGAADTTRRQIVEFAPAEAELPQSELSLPSWLGDPQLHRSHQSNLIRKDAAFYGPQFPGVPGDLEYVWPGPDDLPPKPAVQGTPLWILRATDQAELERWVAQGQVELGEASPAGRAGPKWRAQLETFRTLPIGTRFAAIASSGSELLLGELGSLTSELSREASFNGTLSRSDFPYPALLQDPRSLFETTGPQTP